MFSYNHRFHAGNFADVHKHMALIAILKHLNQKPTPYCVLDTHAGEGIYSLQSQSASRLKEYKNGVLAFCERPPETPLAQEYVNCIQAFNAGSTITQYPGSPAIIQHYLREQDQAIFVEHHPQAVSVLKQHFKKQPQLHIHDRDANQAIGALLPFEAKRGLVFIDPSYEVKSEYTTIVDALMKGYQKFSHGIYVIWYPLLAQTHHVKLKQALKAAKLEKCLFHEWRPFPDAPGMQGSGLAIINPPWQLEQALESTMGSGWNR